jgi:putative phage-type endonuclease
MLKRRVKQLQKKPQPEQRSPEWFEQRQTKITASEAASCLFKSEKVCRNFINTFKLTNFKLNENEPVNPYDTREEYIIKKCSAFYGQNVFRDTPHTLWGKKYEEVATRLYRKLFNVNVIEFGLLNHSKLKWLAASPDGITEDGIMLEIKCPKSRKIDIQAPTLYYYIQMQIQLECTNLDQCDFLECEIKECDSEEEWLNYQLNENQFKGIVLGTQDAYVYPPDNLNSDDDYITWKNSSDLPPSYYIITKYNIMHIKRDKEWFEENKKDMKQVWYIIQKLQKNKEDFIKYKESIDAIKNKGFIEKWNKTDCLIEEDSEGLFVIEDNNNNNNKVENDTIRLSESNCLIETTE